MKSTAFTRIVGVVAAVAMSLSITGCGSSDLTEDGLRRIKVSYSEQVADQLPLWIAQDADYFAHEGLEVELVSLESDQGYPALLAGQIQLASIGGSQILAGAAAGAEVKTVAALTPVFPYELWSKYPAEQLAGKKFGITSASGSVYIATVAALEQLGLAESDVDIVPLGSTTNVNNALAAGSIDAAVSHPPASRAFEKAGMHSVLNLVEQKIANINVGIAVTDAYADENPDVVEGFLAAIKKGIEREKADEAYCLKLLEKHLGETDKVALEETWDFYAGEVLPDVPMPAVDQLEPARSALQGSVDGLEDIDLANVIDTSFVEKVWAQ